jgi:hypothetical protein
MAMVDFSPVLNAVIGLSASALLAGGGLALTRVFTWLGYKADDQRRTLAEGLFQKMIAAGASATEAEIKAKGWDHPDVKNSIIAMGLEYGIKEFQPGLKLAGLDPSDPATPAFIRSSLDRIFATAVAPIVASPVTPPAPSTPGFEALLSPGVTDGVTVSGASLAGATLTITKDVDAAAKPALFVP